MVDGACDDEAAAGQQQRCGQHVGALPLDFEWQAEPPECTRNERRPAETTWYFMCVRIEHERHNNNIASQEIAHTLHRCVALVSKTRNAN